MKTHRSKRFAIAVSSVLVGVVGLFSTRGCLGKHGSSGGQRLVEVFDNGPVGGPAGPSEGYKWVGQDDLPPPGKSWKPTDPTTLTPEQKERIR